MGAMKSAPEPKGILHNPVEGLRGMQGPTPDRDGIPGRKSRDAIGRAG